jgi:hypothetical protein
MMQIDMGLAELEERCFENNSGFCVNCGEEHFGIEPDARNYQCDSCEEMQVFGTSELMMMGQINVIHD